MRDLHPATQRGLCLAAAGILGSLYAVVVPFGEKPDEPSHMARALYEARVGRVPPVWATPVFPNVVTYEAVQPPAYYWVASHLLRLLPPVSWTISPSEYFGCVERSRHFVVEGAHDPPVQVLALRMVGLAFVLASGTLVLGAARMLGVPSAEEVMACAIAILTPQVLFVSTGVTNDGMALAAGNLVLWAAVKAAFHGSATWAFAAGALCVGTVAVKVNLAPYLVGAPAILLGAGARRRGLTTAAFLVGAGALAVPALLHASSPPGDQRGILERLTTPAASVARKDYLAFLRGMLATYWARFGWMDLEAPKIVQIVWTVLLIAASVGWVMGGHRAGRSWVALWFLLAVAMVGWMGTLRSSHQVQGRFFLPYTGVVSLVVARGIGLVPSRVLRAGALAGIGASNLVSLAALRAAYLPAAWPPDMVIDAHQCYADRIVEEPLSSGVEIAQTFVGIREGLCAVDVVFTGVARDGGFVRLTISDARTGHVFRTADLPIAHVEPERWTRFRFAPVKKSADRLLRLALKAHGVDTLATLSLRYALGDPYVEGVRLVGGSPRGGDLKFVAWVQKEEDE